MTLTSRDYRPLLDRADRTVAGDIWHSMAISEARMYPCCVCNAPSVRWLSYTWGSRDLPYLPASGKSLSIYAFCDAHVPSALEVRDDVNV